MDYRKNFVRAMKAAADLDHILAELDELFLQSTKLSMLLIKEQISSADYQYELKQIGHERNKVLEKYSHIGKRIQAIKDEFGGEIKPQ